MSNHLYTIANIRAIEQRAIEQGLSEYQLMQRAGKAALKVLLHYYPKSSSLDIVCGKGNNGGDGYVLARLAAEKGLQVNIYSLAELNELAPTAQNEAKACITAQNKIKKINIQPYNDTVVFKSDVIIDAILGTGAKTILKESLIQKAIHSINKSKRPILAIDVPSGLNVDEGSTFGETICANVTVTFIGIKRGMLTGVAPNYCGKLVCDDLNLPIAYDNLEPSTSTILINHPLPPRKPADHKGLYGHVLVIGGDRGMGGAVCLAAEAALRTGAGLVTAITHPEHVQVLLTRCPEIMCQGVTESMDFNFSLLPLLKKATVCVIGPGMTDSDWSNSLLNWLLTQTSLPVVLDAGALGWLVKNKFRAHKNWVLTPHPGEAGNLLGISSEEIQKARFTNIKALEKKWGGIIVLKGSGTLIFDTSNTPIQVCEYHSSTMATAGMGDVLSGIIGSLIAQGCSSFHAACQGVWLHAKAGELASKVMTKKVSRSNLLAHELFPFLGY